MRSLPMMKAFDPDSDKPIVPKAVSLFCYLGATRSYVSCMQSKARAHFLILFSSDRQWRRPWSVWRHRWRTSCRYATRGAHPACPCKADVTVCRLTRAHVFCFRTSRCRHSTAPLSPTCLPWRVKWTRPPGRLGRAHSHPQSHQMNRNKTFLLCFLKSVVQKLESWMQFWLIFQMAQQKPPTIKATSGDFGILTRKISWTF